MDPFADSDFERLVMVTDLESGLRAIVAIHSTRRGPAFGGIRRRAFEDGAAMLGEVRGLARAMSLKLAYADLPAGGAKTVVWDRPGLDVPRAYAKLGEIIDEMGGAYVAGPDVGTGSAELAHLRERTPYIDPVDNDANAATADGAMAALRGLVDSSEGAFGWDGLRVVVQGLGGVGFQLARRLSDAGASVSVCELREELRSETEARGWGWLTPAEMVLASCDVLVPCALGGWLDESCVSRLQCKAVCGPANNVLASDEVAKELAAKGIVFVPDFVASFGAVAQGVIARGQTRPPARGRIDLEMQRLLDDARTRVAKLVQSARQTGRTPLEVARTEAESRLFRGHV